MRSLYKDALPISSLRLTGSWARLGRCHYHIGKIPYKISTTDEETVVKVNVGLLRSSVNVRVRQPPRPEANGPIIIFLKRGIPTATQNESYLKSLALSANAIVVEIDYHLSTENRYPLPIHTVLAGYDWARTSLITRGDTIDPGRRMISKPSKIGVCGELVGGSLATMLALTECVGKPAELEIPGISALAVGNPILDWTALTQPESDPNAHQGIFRKVTKFPAGANNESLSANDLWAIRQSYFSKPARPFDPFASPLLFFCTSTSEIPTEAPAPNAHDLLNGGPEDANPLSQPIKKRRSARKYPPAGLDLILPWTKVEVGKECVLKDQGVDLVEMMRKSYRRSAAERPADATNPVKREFEVVEREGLGLWDEKHAFEIGQWFGEVLRKP